MCYCSGFSEVFCLGTFGDDSVCVDTDRDPKNCGTCGTVCPDTSTCQGGECQCFINEELCPGTFGDDLVCVDTDRDPKNCGACGTACPAESSCVDGQCVVPEEPTPTAQAVPFGVGSVTDDSLTESRFVQYLPTTLPGWTLVSAGASQVDQVPVYAEAIVSTTFRYSQPGVFHSFSALFANVSVLPPSLSVRDLILRLQSECEGQAECEPIESDSALDRSVVYRIQRSPTVGDQHIHLFLWGNPGGRLAYTFAASSSDDLEALATAFVRNGKARSTEQAK